MSVFTKKSWISPFVAVTFIAVAVTGILLLFHLKLPGVYPIHKWGGLIFVVVGTIHLLLNWRVFVSYFKTSTAIWGTCIGVVILILIALTVPSKKYGHRYHGGEKSTINYQVNWDNPQKS